eukprot:1466700-Prymnesium_polylepis.1
MAPKGAKRKLEPTEWADMDVTGLVVQWKVTSAGMVHFKWEGSSKQTLTLTKDEDVQDAPRRVRARVVEEPAAKAVAKAAAQASRQQELSERSAADAAADTAARTCTQTGAAAAAATALRSDCSSCGDANARHYANGKRLCDTCHPKDEHAHGNLRCLSCQGLVGNTRHVGGTRRCTENI